jgi:hypothetical protein
MGRSARYLRYRDRISSVARSHAGKALLVASWHRQTIGDDYAVEQPIEYRRRATSVLIGVPGMKAFDEFLAKDFPAGNRADRM